MGERGERVSALRKAGVWLGLIEDEEDDRGYDDRGYSESGYRDSGYREGRESREGRGSREARESRYADEFAEDEEFDEAPSVPRSRGTERVPERVEALRAERASVRSITRPAAPEAAGTSASSFATRDSLALKPQVQLRERPAMAEDDERRYQITTLHPTTYREARTIGEHFRDGVPVIINLTEMEEPDARRLVDFAAGLAFGLRGTIERVTNRVFLLSPANVQVTAEDKAKIAEGGFFNQS